MLIARQLISAPPDASIVFSGDAECQASSRCFPYAQSDIEVDKKMRVGVLRAQVQDLATLQLLTDVGGFTSDVKYVQCAWPCRVATPINAAQRVPSGPARMCTIAP
jgi:hypothetical protein